jgi:hypothetical protein
VARLAALALALVFVLNAAPVLAADPALGGEWHLDELAGNGSFAADSSNNGNTLTPGGSGPIDIVPGHFGNAFDFSQGGNLRRSLSASLQPQTVTLMAWVKSPVGPGNVKYIAAQGGTLDCNGGASYALYTGASPNGNRLEFYVTTDSGLYESPRAESTIWDGQWHAVAGTYDGATVRFYLDGTEIGTGTPATGALNYALSTDDFTVATFPGCAGPFQFAGQIDEVRVYDRVLTPDEIHELQTAPGPDPPELSQAGGGPGGGGPGGGEPGGGPIPPEARVVTGQSAAIANGAWLSGASSVAAAGNTVTDYSWDIDGSGRFAFNCGLASALSVGFVQPGTHTVGLQVTDQAGQISRVEQQVTTTQAARTPPPRVTTFDCENPGANNQPDSADCVKSFGFGVVDVNSRGAAGDCFQIVSKVKTGAVLSHPGFQPRATAAAGQRFLDYVGTVKGPVAMNGLYMPLPESATSQYDSGRLSVGIPPIEIRFGDYKTVRVDLSKQLIPDKNGVAHLVDANLSGKVPVLGGLPVQGGIAIDLTPGVSRTKLHVGLPNVFTLGGGQPAQGDVTLLSDNVNGVHIDGAKLGPLRAWLGPVLLSNLQFEFLKSQNLWQGGAQVTLPASQLALDAAPPPPDLGFGLRGGQFDHAGLQVNFLPPTQPVLFPGITLEHLGGAFGIRPVRLTGTASLAAGEVFTIDGDLFVAFASPSQHYELPADAGEQLSQLAGRTFDSFTVAIAGTASAHIPVIDQNLALAHAYLLYQYPDYVEVAGGFSFAYSFVSVDGGVKGFVAPSAGKFNLEGGVKGCLRNISIGPVDLDFICLNVGAIVSTRGLGFCGTVPVPFPVVGTIPVPVGVGYQWGSALPDLKVFSCDYDAYREQSPRAAQASGERSFTLPSGLPSAMFRLIGRDGPPEATLTGPGGERISTADPPADKGVVVVHLKDAKETLVAVKKPAAGAWSIVPDDGSTPIVSAASAQGLPDPKVTARVTRRGRARVLSYKVRTAPGRTIAFAERGAHAARFLGTAHGSSGRIRFSPAPGPPEKREIVALVDQNGEPAHSIVVATYRSAGSPRLLRPRGLRAVRRGRVATATWKRVPGASRYAVTLLSGDGARTMVLTKRPKVSLRLPTGRGRATVIVNAVSPDNSRGPAARVSVRAPKRAKRR